MEQEPLVSVIVVAYNSAGYILETLDSIRAQTYANIELIIADDASQDETMAVAESWLLTNGGRFSGAKAVRNSINGGIAPNCNNGLRHARGEWIKLIAADDMLLENCIADNVAFVSRQPETAVVFSGMDRVDENGKRIDRYFFPAHFFNMGTKAQLCALLHRNCLAAPAAFINRKALEEVGGFDPVYPMMEDLPMWIKLLDRGYKLGGMETVTILYRVHGTSIHGKKGKGKSSFLLASDAFDWAIRLPLAGKTSPGIYTTVLIDILVSRMVRKPLVLKLFYPCFWAWSRFSPFTISRKPISN